MTHQPDDLELQFELDYANVPLSRLVDAQRTFMSLQTPSAIRSRGSMKVRRPGSFQTSSRAASMWSSGPSCSGLL